MDKRPEDREFGPPISRNKRLALGIAMLVALIGIVLLVILEAPPSG
jgi:hypothetical protein